MRLSALALLGIHLASLAAAQDARLDVRETAVGAAAEVVVETITPSSDGRRLAYAARRGDKLVLTVDGKQVSKPYDGFGAGGIVFSPSSARVAAMVSPSADKWTLLVDGEEGQAYDAFARDSLTFSLDSNHVAVVAARGNKRLVVVDGNEGKPYDDVKAFAFAPGSLVEPGNGEPKVVRHKPAARYAYAARTLADWTIVTDAGETGRSYTAIGDAPILFDPNGTRHVFTATKDGQAALPPAADGRVAEGRVATGQWFVSSAAEGGFFDELPPAAIRFSPDGATIAYAGRVGERWLVLTDGKAEPDAYEQVMPESLAWRADGSLVFAARTPRGWAVVDGRKPGPAFDELVFPPELSADRRHLAYVGVRAGRHVVVADGVEGGPHEQVMDPPTLSPEGRVAYVARRGGQQFVVLDGKEGPAFDAVGRLAFSPNGRQLAYGAQRGNSSVIRVGDRESPAFTGFLPRTRLAFEDEKTLHAQTFRGEQLFQVKVTLGAESDSGASR